MGNHTSSPKCFRSPDEDEISAHQIKSKKSHRRWLGRKKSVEKEDEEVYVDANAKQNNVDRVREERLNNHRDKDKRSSLTVNDVVVKWQTVNQKWPAANVPLHKSNSADGGKFLNSVNSHNPDTENLTSEFLMQIIRIFPFPTPKSSPRIDHRPVRGNKRHRSMLERGTRMRAPENTNRLQLSRRKSEGKIASSTTSNKTLNQIVMKTVDTIAVTALPLDCWLKERLKHWCQLSGHEGTIVPATEHTLWKKQNPSDGSKEANAYKEMMDDVLCMCVPKFYKDISYKGDNFIEIQDLTRLFTNPAIMDIKMGTRTFLESEVTNPVMRHDLYEKMMKLDVNAPTKEEHEQKAVTKLRYMQFRERESTTASLGFRIEAIKMPSKPCNKDYQKIHTRAEVTGVLADFLSESPSNSVKKAVMKRLKVIRDRVGRSEFFESHEVIGSSLLFMYDLNGDCGVWMIDFAKSLRVQDRNIDHRTPWKMGNHEDGYLIGVDNLIQVFDDTGFISRTR